jgi:aryl-alcohol dehydrogenase-like predicted oxidoreductase
MRHAVLGRTGIHVSALAFGAGPVSTLMVGDDRPRQLAVVAHALARGINWIDTAATYGGGQSERGLGDVLAEIGAASQIHVATKVRLMPADLGDIRGAVRRSLTGSLQRLRLSRVTLLQLHNSITIRRGDEPTSLTPHDVLGPHGVAEAFHELRSEGLALHLGLTGIGHPAALAEVTRAGQFATIQVPYHLLNPSAGRAMGPGFGDTDYGNIIATCAEQGMGVMAIRVLAGGALAGHPPSPHTLTTPFFPLALFERDRRRADRLAAKYGRSRLTQEAIRFPVCHPHIHAAIIGFADAAQIDQAVAALQRSDPPLTYEEIQSVVEGDERGA